MSVFNGAYSAPRGYDLRVPHNVTMGQIRCLRVVQPFSPASYQKDSITEPFESSSLPPIPPVIPKLNECERYFQGAYDPCTCQYFLAPGNAQTTHAQITVKKVYKRKWYIK